MKTTMRIIIGIAITLIVFTGIIWLAFMPNHIDVSDVQNIYLETIDQKGTIRKVEINNKSDMQEIKRVLPETTISDSGFVFAEGGWRIVLLTSKSEIKLYPYCGADLSLMRVGDNGSLFYGPEESSICKI